MKRNKYIVCFVFLLIFSQNIGYTASIFCADIRLNKKVKSMREIKDSKVIKQTLDYSCGPAGLATIFKYHFGESLGETEIINYLLQSIDIEKVKRRGGFSLLDLKRFAQAKGYKVEGYTMNMDFLKEQSVPVLVPIKFKNYRHFVVVKAVIGDRVFFADPAIGNMTMKIDRFERIWQKGIGLIIEGKVFRDPFISPLLFSMEVEKNDLTVVDYNNVKRIFETNLIRTAIFPTEF